VSSLTTEQGTVHYEAIGQGSPVVFLHGLFSSWDVWQQTMEFLGPRYRTYALDFSVSNSPNGSRLHAIRELVGLVDAFMDRLGLDCAPLVGHCMGGTVSLAMAIVHPVRVAKLGIVCAPVAGSSLTPGARFLGRRLTAAVLRAFPGLLRRGLHRVVPALTQDRQRLDADSRDLSRDWAASLCARIASLANTDLRPHLKEIRVPTLGVYGGQDLIVNPHEWETLATGIPGARVECFDEAGHFPMLDDPARFRQALLPFLAQEMP
jgi:pimeloyl-ACP methyl ester carboxylesterase